MNRIPVLRSSLLLLLGLVFATPAPGQNNRFGHAEPAPRTPGAVRVAAYNVLNLFDNVDDPALKDNAEDLTMETTDARCRAIAAAIRKADADIVALAEVESLACLTAFRDHYLEGMGYEFIASVDVGYYRGVECSVLSRHRITNIETWPETDLSQVKRDGPGFSPVPADRVKGLRYQRSPMLVDVQINDDYALTLVVLHHKAGGRNRWHREAEALATTERLRGMMIEDPDRNIIVLGDFNAAPWDKSLRLYLEAGLIDTMGHRVIPRWENADQAEANLFKTHESGRVLDYILMNSAAHREFVIGSARVLGTLYDPEYDWKTDPHPKGYASDHYPIMIEITPHDRAQ